ncbi:MAG TPA: shikimate kinase [Rickettsiales bacterium]|nr:shikimate kinase [Rickettsiales bacterium]
MSKYKRVLIIGFRATGKSKIAKKLSEAIGITFLDTDDEIEKEQGKTITEISENGKNWEVFRDLELKKIEDLLQKDNIIISAGGGVGVNNINGDIQREKILANTNTLKVLLVSKEEMIRKRLYEDKIKENNRPDLYGKTDINIEEFLDNNIKIMRERKLNYERMADIIIDTTDYLETKEILKLYEKN